MNKEPQKSAMPVSNGSNQELLELVERSNSCDKNSIKTQTMLTPMEQSFLIELVEKHYTGSGAIFDGGCCLGGSTECFARGLAAKTVLPDLSPCIHSYELGIIDENDYVREFIKNTRGTELSQGDSFVDIIKDNIASMPCNDRIALHPGDILSFTYPEAIEILFLDVCKSPQLNYEMNKLISRLVPGQGLLIQQDFVHAWTPWIILTLGYLAEYLDPIGIVGPTSFVCRVPKPIPDDVLAFDVYNELPLEELEKYLKTFIDLVPENQLVNFDMASAALHCYKKNYAKCRDILTGLMEYKQSGRPIPWDFDALCSYLANTIGEPSIVVQKEIPQNQKRGSASFLKYIHRKYRKLFPKKKNNLVSRNSGTESPETGIASGSKISGQEINAIRAFSADNESTSQTSTEYQNDILFFLQRNEHRGDSVVEIGCYRGGLTVQYAYLCKKLNKHLHVVDIDETMLNHVKGLVDRLGFGDSVSYHAMDCEKFMKSVGPDRIIATILDADHSYDACKKDCLALQKALHRMHGVLFHDFSLRCTQWGGMGVDLAIYDVFGKDVNLVPIGQKFFDSGPVNPDGFYYESNEGAAMIVPWQPKTVFGA